MSEVNETAPEELPKSNDPSLEKLAEPVKLGGPGDMPPPPGYDPNSGLPPAPPVPEAPPDETRTTLGDVPHPELRAPMPGPGAPAPPAEPERRLSSDMFEIEPGTLPPHRFAAFFPPMSPSEYDGLVTSMDVCGQEYLAVRFQGQLLDGRNRDMACKELGKNLQIVDFLGTEDEAFDHVVNVNRHRRGLTKSQCAAVAVELLPYLCADINRDRIRKLRETLRRKREGECSPLMANTQTGDREVVDVYVIAGEIMNVGHTYVTMAARVKREDPELFLKIWNGQITVTAAINVLDGITDSDEVREIKSLRRMQNAILRDPDRPPNFVKLWRQFLAQFRDGG